MAFFLRDDARDDLNARPKGKSMKFQPSGNNPIFDERAQAKEHASKIMESYENPLHAPTYDPMMAYRANAVTSSIPQTTNDSFGNSALNNVQNNNNKNTNFGGGAGGGNGLAPQRKGPDYGDDYHFNGQQQQQHQYQHDPSGFEAEVGSGGRARGRSTTTSIGVGMHIREERPMMASKKMVHAGDDMNRRGNGNILAPPPLTWEESKPKIRGHQQLPDSYLHQIASKDEHVRDEQIKNMAKCGQENFYKGFSNKPDRPIGTHKVPQDDKVVNNSGIGIWGFGGLGKMSEESTGGLKKKKTYHLEPIESHEARQSRLGAAAATAANSPHTHNNGGGFNYSGSGSGGGVSPKQANNNNYNYNNNGNKYQDRPWARPSDLQQQKLQNGFSDDSNLYQQNRSVTSLGMGSSSSAPVKQQSPYRAQVVAAREKNANVMSQCFNYVHDKSSTDVALRKRHNRYPDPSTVPFTNDVVYKPHGAGASALNMGGGLDIGLHQNAHSPLRQQGSMLASPPGARFVSRSDTTSGAAYMVPRSQTSFNLKKKNGSGNWDEWKG